MESSPSKHNYTPIPDEAGRPATWRRSNLAPGQWLLWHEQRRQPPYVLAPLALTFTFGANVDIRHFRLAFQSVVDRSDALRTVFVEEAGLPQRYVLPHLPLAMEVVDLSAAYQPFAAYEQWHAERDLHPLSPTQRPFDSALVRLGDQHYVWRLALHRLIADSYSLLLIYRRTAEAYAASLADALGALPPLPAFEDFAIAARQQVSDPAVLDTAAAESRLLVMRPLLHPGGGYALDLGAERTARLRGLAAGLADENLPEKSALFLVCATALAALLAQVRKCRAVCIDTTMDMRQHEPWQETIGSISRAHTFSVEVAPGQPLSRLLHEVGTALAQARRQVQVAPIGGRPAAFCRVLLQVDDLTFGPFGDLPTKVERLDACYSQRRLREPRETKGEPLLCLALDSYASRENLRASFTFCGHSQQGRGPQLAQEYIRLLDALLAAREQPVQDIGWGFGVTD